MYIADIQRYKIKYFVMRWYLKSVMRLDYLNMQNQ